jgi:tripartite-type tricarboxylate transporter receptor subunit TctC
MNTNRRSLVSALAASPALAITPAWAQAAFPSRPIRIVISFPPGSTSDLLARRIGEHAGKALGQPVVVESKPGGQGVVAARTVINAPKDGYTLFLGTNSSHAANVHLIKDLGYDPIKDFTPITQLTMNPLLLAVNAEIPANTVQEFIRYAKERPGKLNYGTGNTGGMVATQMLRSSAGIDAVGVNYPGTAQATNDLAAGRLHFMMIDPLVIRPFAQSAKVRILGITSMERLSSMPEVAPLAELGLPGFDYASWAGLFGPAGLPADVIGKLVQAFSGAARDGANVAHFAGQGMIATATHGDAFAAFVRDQIQFWGRLVKETGLSAQ